MDRFLSMIGKTEQEYRDQFRQEATERVKRSLALSQFIEDEGITVTPEEVDADIERMAGDSGLTGDQIRQIFGGESGRDVLQRSLLTRKAQDRLAEIAEGKPVPPRPEKSEAATAGTETSEAAQAAATSTEGHTPVEPEAEAGAAAAASTETPASPAAAPEAEAEKES
jgi:FKBP-type peptidyl-prolyl cis-trans isomerase (trigger factor)